MTRVAIKASLAAAIAVAVVATVTNPTAAQVRTPAQRMLPRPGTPGFANLKIETLKIQGFNKTNVYLIAGAGGNIVTQVGADGALVVDTGYAQMADKVLATIKELSPEPIRVVINTTYFEDHTGGNETIVSAGRLNQSGPGVGGRANVATSIAHPNLLGIMTDLGPEKVPVGRWPVDTSYPSVFSDGTKGKDLFLNDEAVIIMHVPNANTDGDSMVFFRKSDVLVMGELFNEASYPVIDLEHGGTINGIIEGLNKGLNITVPRHLQEGGTMVVPGHGRIGDEHDLLEYRDMVTIIRNRVQKLMDKGQSLAQIKAAKVTYEYDPRWNRNPAWTADMFVEAIYKNLSEKP
ncbi:MAG TPA: MBL fold metallo-hydrolase [Terriglobia bacterium]|nr:MBL fold metallo-hydrolase [Terriglobia bacterium]